MPLLRTKHVNQLYVLIRVLVSCHVIPFASWMVHWPADNRLADSQSSGWQRCFASNVRANSVDNCPTVATNQFCYVWHRPFLGERFPTVCVVTLLQLYHVVKVLHTALVHVHYSMSGIAKQSATRVSREQTHNDYVCTGIFLMRSMGLVVCTRVSFNTCCCIVAAARRPSRELHHFLASKMEQCVGRLITSSDSEEHGLLRADIVQACETYAKASCSSLGKQQLQQFFLLATAYKACLLRPRMWPKIFVHMTQYIRCELKIHDIDCLLRLVSAVGLLQMARSSTLQLDVTTVSITESGKKWYNKRTSHTGQLMSIVEEGVKHAELMELLQPWMDGSGNQAAPVSSADDSAKARDLLHSHEVLRAWAFAVLHWVKGYDRSNRFCLVQLSQELASMGPSFVEFMLGSGEPEQQMQQLRGLLQQLLTGPFAGYVQSMPAAEWLTQPGCRKTAAQAAAVGAAAAQVLPGEGIYLLDEQCPLLEIAINMFSPDADNMDTGDDADSENAGVEDTDHAGTSSNNNTLQLPPEVWSCAARKYSQHGLGSRKGGLASSVAELKRNIKRMWPDSDIVLVGAQVRAP